MYLNKYIFIVIFKIIVPFNFFVEFSYNNIARKKMKHEKQNSSHRSLSKPEFQSSWDASKICVQKWHGTEYSCKS